MPCEVPLTLTISLACIPLSHWHISFGNHFNTSKQERSYVVEICTQSNYTTLTFNSITNRQSEKLN